MNRRTKRLNEKGFIGPIGDDLPSLIPLTFALVVFFAAFAFAFNTFDQKKTDFDQKFALLRLGKTLKSDNLIDEYAEWKNACDSLELQGFRFFAVVFVVNTDPDQPFLDYQFFDLAYNRGNNSEIVFRFVGTGAGENRRTAMQNRTGRSLICPDPAPEPLRFSDAGALKPLRINFPVAVNDAGVIRPANLAVMIWH